MPASLILSFSRSRSRSLSLDGFLFLEVVECEELPSFPVMFKFVGGRGVIGLLVLFDFECDSESCFLFLCFFIGFVFLYKKRRWNSSRK